MNPKTPFFEQVKAAGIPFGNHESDLYIPVTPATTALIKAYKYKENVKPFRSQIDNRLWYDIPFAYLPFWEQKAKGQA